MALKLCEIRWLKHAYIEKTSIIKIKTNKKINLNMQTISSRFRVNHLRK